MEKKKISSVYMTDKQKEKLSKAASDAGMSLSSYMVSSSLEKAGKK